MLTCGHTTIHASSACNEDKSVSYLIQNLDSILARFTNKAKLQFKAASLEEYKSRFKTTLEDFQTWSIDPAAWERSLAEKAKPAKSSEPRKEKSTTTAKAKVAPAPQPAATHQSHAGDRANKAYISCGRWLALG